MRKPLKPFSTNAVMALATLLALPAHAADDTSHDWRQQCPGANAWVQAHPGHTLSAMRRRDEARQLTQPDLLAELQRRTEADQSARQRYLANLNGRAERQATARVDADNYAWVSRLLARDGLPTAAQVGEYGLHLLWLLVHHADNHPDFQAQALALLQRSHAVSDFNSEDLARFTDRVRVNQHLQQPYGTQADWGKSMPGVTALMPLDEVERIDANRRELGLMPLADYACMMHTLRKPDGG